MTSPAPLTSAERSTASLRDYLVAHAIAGPVATPRQDSLAKYRRMVAGDWQCTFGLRFSRPWTVEDVLAEMALRCGVSGDTAVQHGPDFIDPDRTIDRLRAMAARLREVAAASGTVLLGTGHPAGVLAIHAVLSRRLRAAGCQVLTPASGWRGRPLFDDQQLDGELRYWDRVAVISAFGGLAHTHAPAPMLAMLADLRRSGQPMPDLVVADHGFAGAAGEAGLRVVGFADCNDPALFVGEAEDLIDVSVPLDDNVSPDLYAPVTAFLLAQAGL
jgi:Phosphatase